MGRNRFRGPFTAKNFRDLVLAAGCEEVAGGKHMAYRHPTNGKKITISQSWTGVKCGDPVFKSFVDFFGISKDELLDMLDEVR
ncbi:MAG: hypothetical protein ACPHCI_08670 [Solirubrobacterales bacterium]